MAEKKKIDSYKVAVSGASTVLRILIYIAVILLIFVVARAAYKFGYNVFDQKPMALTKDSAQEVTVEIKPDTSAHQVGKLLVSKGLIRNAEVFWAQEKLSDYKGMIKPGTYVLNTYQTADEIIKILAGEEEKTE